MSNVRLPAAAVLAFSLAACSATYTVQPTAADSACLAALEKELAHEPFFVPAEARFNGTLAGEAPIAAQSRSFFAFCPNVYLLPVFPAVRQALAQAVASCFAAPYRGDETDMYLHERAISDALWIEFKLAKVLSDHGGGAGDMTLTLKVDCEVRYPEPDHRLLARIPVEVIVTSRMNEDGSGASGETGPLWKAAAELARRTSAALPGPKVLEHFKNREAFIERVHSTTGEPAPRDDPNVKFDAFGKHGEYVEVVRLIKRK
ncbi:MAG: hypothetical protein HY812_11850 [Planctomycetes bacterium]|nr:hypothetical protein [Planctomycetota bacterium]